MEASSRVTTTISTTTLVPGITQPDGLAPLDLLARYPMQHLLLDRFSSNTIVVDRYLSPLWLPFALIGCTVCTVVYAFSSCKCSQRVASSSTNRFGISSGINITQSVYLTSISIVLLIRAILVILIDLDTAWDTGLLAWNQLFCPLTHTLSTASKLASALLTLALGIEALCMNYPKSRVLLYSPIRYFVARGRYRKSVHLTVALILTSLAFGLLETAYWRVQYYLPSVLGQGSHIYQGHAPRPLARCEVTGSFHHMFTTRVDRSSVDGFLDEATNQYGSATRLAASYADYKWISGITVDSIISLASICVSLAVLRAQLMTTGDREMLADRRSRMGSAYSLLTKQDLGHVIALNLIQGLCRLPEELFAMLEPLTRPGEVNLTDAEIELDGTWQRYFMMFTARVVCSELADFPGACILPVCLVFSPQFRTQFCDIFGCWFPVSKLPNRGHAAQQIRSQSESAVHDSDPGSWANYVNEMSCCSPLSSRQPMQRTPHTHPESERSQMSPVNTRLTDGPRPLWKWGQGWVISQPSVDRGHTKQYAQIKRTLTSSEPLYHPSDRKMASNQTRFVPYGRGLEIGSGRMMAHATYQQRAASVNDLLYDPRQNADNWSKSLPRVHNQAEWFEPRSYV
ncbi:unnamed protein product [Echinostoma caproni]|uniref:G_PROTEIN_RECEP_F1_2 domain-containing protein n=1 Tax=Echinostoma caproni TaxID=27848 RepID=A0A183ADW6_9TREM|nr:unnamed protein product [Echinostoma caproni]